MKILLPKIFAILAVCALSPIQLRAATLVDLTFDNDGPNGANTGNAANPYSPATADIVSGVVGSASGISLVSSAPETPQIVTNTGPKGGLALSLFNTPRNNAGYNINLGLGIYTAITYEAVVNLVDLNVPLSTIFLDANQGGAELRVHGSNLEFNFGSNPPIDYNYTSLVGQWVDIAAVEFQSNGTATTQLYVNNVLVGSQTAANNTTCQYGPVSLGYNPWAAGRNPNVMIEEFAVSSAALVPGSFVIESKAANVNVAVGTSLSETGGDDMATIRSYFGSSSIPENNYTGDLTSVFAQGQALGMNGMRIINYDAGWFLDINNGSIINSPSGDLFLDAKGTLNPNSALRADLATVHQYHAIPWIVVAQGAPGYLVTQNGYPWNWTPAQWADYQTYCNNFVRYVATQCTDSYGGPGFPVVRFEVTNEWNDSTTPIWFNANSYNPTGSATWTGLPAWDPQRLAAIIQIYKYWANAVQAEAAALQAANSSTKVLVGGPTLNGALWNSWIPAFITGVHGYRLDDLTIHNYQGDTDVGNDSGALAGASLITVLQSLRTDLINAGYSPATAISDSEWGPNGYPSASGIAGHDCYSNAGAAWAAAFFKDAVKGGLSFSQELVYDDLFGNDSVGNYAFNSMWYAPNTTDVLPKPFVNVCKMINLMPGARRQVSTDPTHPDLGAIASASPNASAVMVFNYNCNYYEPAVPAYPGAPTDSDVSAPEGVAVQFTNLPFNGVATVTQYLIDATHSNLGQYIDAGNLSPSFASCDLQQVGTSLVTVTNGAVTLPQVTLGQSSVSLWVIKRTLIGKTIALQSQANNLYVTVGNGGGSTLFAGSRSIGTSEEFNVVDGGNGSIALQSQANGLYVSAGNSGRSLLIASSASINAPQKFNVIDTGNGGVALQSLVSSLYVTGGSTGGFPLAAKSGAIGTPTEYTALVAPISTAAVSH